MYLAGEATARRAPLSLEEAFWAADYDRCSELFAVMPPTVETEMLRARVHIRLHQYHEAIDVLQCIPSEEALPQRLAILARAYAYVNDHEHANEALEQALNRASTTAERDEAQYAEAMVAWMRKDLNHSASIAEALLRSNGRTRSEAYNLLGWIWSERESYDAAIAAFRESYANAGRHVFARAHALWPLAVFAKERIDSELAQFVAREAQRIEWTPALATHRFHLVRCLSWFDAFQGDLRATRNGLRQAARLAPSNEWRAFIVAEQAYFTLLAGSREIGLADLDEACEIADGCNWNNAAGEERLTLLTLAQMLSGTEIIRAARYLKLYEAPSKSDALAAFSRNIRTRAIESFTRATIAHAQGDTKSASRLYADAHRMWVRIGFTWRSIMAALGRYELGGIVQRDIGEYIAISVKKIPHSWIRQHIEERIKRPSQPELGKFTPRQIEVLQSLCAGGKTDAAIGAELHMSAFSVRDHLKEIRKRVGVKNRAQLIAWCAKMGIPA